MGLVKTQHHHDVENAEGDNEAVLGKMSIVFPESEIPHDLVT
jgi:hypothetical protein